MPDDFHRTNINLHASDVAYFQAKYGYGWTEKIREIVHDWVLDREIAQVPEPGTDEFEDRAILDVELNDGSDAA